MHLFEKFLSVTTEEIEIELRGHTAVEWFDFLLNPRRLRGSDFLMRWSQGVWSEERIIQAVNSTEDFYAIPYGPSGTAPDNDVRSFELYFERLEKAGLGKNKRPDLLIFKKSAQKTVDALVSRLGGVSELPFTPEDSNVIQQLLARAILAVECENSLWKARLMPDYGTGLKPQKRLGGKLGLRRNAVVPTLILKEEDLKPLQMWQNTNRIPIHIWHIFYDVGFGISFDKAQELIEEGLILPIKQIFQAPGGAITSKIIYKIYYHYAYHLCDVIQEPELKARVIEDRNGHILPYVHFEGGKIDLKEEALKIMREIANVRG